MSVVPLRAPMSAFGRPSFCGGCFAPEVPVRLASGELRAAADLALGDHLAEGGRLTGLGDMVLGDPWLYAGLVVAPDNLVLEGDVWLRVRDSVLGRSLPESFPRAVRVLICQWHLVATPFALFADAREGEEPDASPIVSILNREDGIAATSHGCVAGSRVGDGRLPPLQP